MNGILGKKIGMTNIFDKDGYFVPVTVIEAGPCYVLGTKTQEKEGYQAVILGYGELKPEKAKKPQKAWFGKLKMAPKRMIKEIRTDKAAEYKVGDKISIKIFKAGDYVDVSGTTKGKGFQGVVRRWKWKGGDRGHGSMFHRAPGSIGASSDPSRVFKGHPLPGHMGAKKRTIQNLEIVDVNEEKGLLLIKGAVPGHKNSYVLIRHAKKIAPQREEKSDNEPAKDKGQKK